MNAHANTTQNNVSKHMQGVSLHSSLAPHRMAEDAHGVLLDWRLVLVYLAIGIAALFLL